MEPNSGSGMPAAGQGQEHAAELIGKWSALAERSQQMVQEFAARQMQQANGSEFQLIDMQNLAEAFLSFNQKLMEKPEKLIEAQTALMQQSLDLWQSTMKRMMGEPALPVAAPDPGDRRFKDAAWSEDLVFDYLKQSYLITSRVLRDTVAEVDDIDPAIKNKVDFYTRQYLSAASPSNFALTNPEVLRKAEQTEGESLLNGLEQLLDDLEKGRGRLKISMTRDDAFEVGVNVATTPGKVVFENELMQLIQYAPKTDSVHDVPFLIVPPWINKFYILDLQPRNSLVNWLLEQGHTVFLISWVNPDKRHEAKTFEDYMKQGPLAALDAIGEALETDDQPVNVLGFCIGGILLSATLAWLAAKCDARVQSATLLASMVDLTDTGEVSVFVDEEQVERIEGFVEGPGYLDGRHMGEMFSMMRENDLIWSFVVNNYLLGREPMPFDLLYWNADATRLPAAMLIFYLRKFYLENGLIKPGHIELDGVGIDLSMVKTPVYALATRDDHIAPWKSCFPAVSAFGGEVQFTLGGSGHIAGIVNPPSRKKYGYMTKGVSDDPDRWLEEAEQHEGSWWPHWGQWLERFTGEKVDARIPGEGGLEVIEDAPGRYVQVKSEG